jgi:phosphatidate cytidylyltransferase
MSNNIIRILTGLILAALGVCLGVAEYHGIPAVRFAAAAVAIVMFAEFLYQAGKRKTNCLSRPYFLLTSFYLILFILSAWFVGARPLEMLLILVVVVAADTGGWFFGPRIGGAKMWPELSPKKTWAGQIAGVICGGLAAYALTRVSFMVLPGIAIALLAQYGDLAASAVKRKLGIKDFGGILPGHGGIADRFDGWLFILPIAWILGI